MKNAIKQILIKNQNVIAGYFIVFGPFALTNLILYLEKNSKIFDNVIKESNSIPFYIMLALIISPGWFGFYLTPWSIKKKIILILLYTPPYFFLLFCYTVFYTLTTSGGMKC